MFDNEQVVVMIYLYLRVRAVLGTAGWLCGCHTPVLYENG